MDLKPVEEAVLGAEEVRATERLCLCPTCPAFPEADRGKKAAYCLRGASGHKDDIDPKACLCEGCEIYKHGRLTGSNFFCLTGAALAKGMRNVLSGRLITKLGEEKRESGPWLAIDAGLAVHERHD